jgi:hypothetical protein
MDLNILYCIDCLVRSEHWLEQTVCGVLVHHIPPTGTRSADAARRITT